MLFDYLPDKKSLCFDSKYIIEYKSSKYNKISVSVKLHRGNSWGKLQKGHHTKMS